MYNHTTNHWTSEHLRQLDPRHPAAWKYLQQWLKNWCEANPRTDVVRLTSLFYNFVWIFGLRRSRSISKVFFPVIAYNAARLVERNVLPSPDSVEVTQITIFSLRLSTNSIRVRIARSISA